MNKTLFLQLPNDQLCSKITTGRSMILPVDQVSSYDQVTLAVEHFFVVVNRLELVHWLR